MRTLDYLTDPALAAVYWPGVLAALALVFLCAFLSVVVVLKRLAFIGQGVSHAAFGGIGLAAVLGLTATTTAAAPYHGVGQFGVVLLFCLGAALLIGVLSERGAVQADTVIGIVLVASMALGAVLIAASKTGLAWESFLFGSLFGVTWADAATAWVLAVVVLAALWWIRRPLLFWAFDEPSARAFGVRSGGIKLLLMVLLALATVTAMKLAGVVLATALLVMPGAIALRLSERLVPVLALSLAAATVSILGGVVLAFEANWPPGPSIVCILSVLYAAAYGAGVLVRREARA